MIHWLLHRLDERRLKGRDHNMRTALQWGQRMSTTNLLPEGLLDPVERARLVLQIEKVFPDGYLPVMDHAEAQSRLYSIGHLLGDVLHSEASDEERIGFGLRLWAGTVIGMKTIAAGTRSGRNRALTRERKAPHVDALCEQDPVFAAGVDCAPLVKTLRRQTWSVVGIPQESWARAGTDVPDRNNDEE